MIGKRIALLFTAVLTAAAVSCSGNGKNSGGNGDPNSDTGEAHPELTVTFFDVGKADSMVIQSENGTVVIDCGEKGDGKELVKYLKDQDISTVDCLIVTHYDKDHVGGAAKLINKLEVKRVLGPYYQEFSEENDNFRDAMKNAGIEPEYIRTDRSFELDGAEYTVYAPKEENYGPDNDNDFSLVTKLKYYDTSFVFTGDAMDKRLAEVMDIGDCDLLKVPYHGRKLGNLDDFLDSITPEYAVVSTSEKEFSKFTEDALDSRDIDYWTTFDNGTITAHSDGVKVSVTAEK